MAKVNERKHLRSHELYKVVAQEDYTLKALFMDGTLKIYDVKPLINGAPLCEGEPVPRCGNVPIFSAFNSQLLRP